MLTGALSAPQRSLNVAAFACGGRDSTVRGRGAAAATVATATNLSSACGCVPTEVRMCGARTFNLLLTSPYKLTLITVALRWPCVLTVPGLYALAYGASAGVQVALPPPNHWEINVCDLKTVYRLRLYR